MLVVEDDAFDAGAAFLETLRFTFVRAIDLDVVFDLARLFEVRVELLAVVLTAIAIAAMRLEKFASTVSQHERNITMSVERNGPNEVLLAQVP